MTIALERSRTQVAQPLPPTTGPPSTPGPRPTRTTRRKPAARAVPGPGYPQSDASTPAPTIPIRRAPATTPPLPCATPGPAPTPPAASVPGPPPVSSLNDPAVIAAWNRQEAIVSNAYFPAQVLDSFALGDLASVTAIRLFLARFREEAGASGDAVEKVLLDQLAVAHLKVGELYALVAGASNLEFKQLYYNAAARLIGSICQLVATLTHYRTGAQAPRRPRPTSRCVAQLDDAGPAEGDPGTTTGGGVPDSEQGSKNAKGRR